MQVAVALTFVAGFAALSIDIGHAYWARGEIQRASDAAALAGTSSYLSDAGMLVALGEVPWSESGELAGIINARSQDYAFQNPTLGDGTILELADIVKGTHDFTNPSAPLDTSGTQRFNAVQIALWRTPDSSNGGIPYLFGPVIGSTEGGVNAFATAALDDRFGGYRQTEEFGLLLPFTIHRDIYYDMVVNGPDGFSYDEGTDT
ncbi:MAG: pilus assembly protein TadG-related protein, partial [Planctomycetota bacterium]